MNPELKAGHKAAHFHGKSVGNPGLAADRLLWLWRGIRLQSVGALLVLG
jgi:hypothetical protein